MFKKIISFYFTILCFSLANAQEPIPVVNDKAEVTKRNILYQLINGYFEFIGIEVGKRKKS